MIRSSSKAPLRRRGRKTTRRKRKRRRSKTRLYQKFRIQASRGEIKHGPVQRLANYPIINRNSVNSSRERYRKMPCKKRDHNTRLENAEEMSRGERRINDKVRLNHRCHRCGDWQLYRKDIALTGLLTAPVIEKKTVQQVQLLRKARPHLECRDSSYLSTSFIDSEVQVAPNRLQCSRWCTSARLCLNCCHGFSKGGNFWSRHGFDGWLLLFATLLIFSLCHNNGK